MSLSGKKRWQQTTDSREASLSSYWTVLKHIAQGTDPTIEKKKKKRDYK